MTKGLHSETNQLYRALKGPLTLAIFAAILAAIFAAISSAISNHPSKLLAIQTAAESPVVYTGDLKSPWNRHEIAAKIASVNGL